MPFIPPRRHGRKSYQQIRSKADEGPEPQDAIAFVIDKHLWVLLEKAALFFRLDTDAVPSEYQIEAQPHVVEFFAKAKAFKTNLPPLQVQRGDSTTLGSITVNDRLLEAVHKAHSDVAWYAWENWFLGKNAAGEIVALWKMADGSALHEAFIVNINHTLWACTSKFAMQLSAPKDHVDKMRASAVGPEMTAAVMKQIDLASSGMVVEAIRGDIETTVGGARVPTEQVMVIEYMASQRGTLEWLYVGPGLPVGARCNGDLVAFVAPMGEATKAEAVPYNANLN